MSDKTYRFYVDRNAEADMIEMQLAVKEQELATLRTDMKWNIVKAVGWTLVLVALIGLLVLLLANPMGVGAAPLGEWQDVVEQMDATQRVHAYLFRESCI